MPLHFLTELRLWWLVEHGYGFYFYQEVGAAEFGLDSGGGGERVESLLGVEGGALFVELSVVAIDVAEVTRGAHHIFPCGAFGGEQRGDVLESAAALAGEVADMDGGAVFIDAGGAGDEENDESIEIDTHTTGEGAGLGVVEGFVEDGVVGHGAFEDGEDVEGLARIVGRHDGLLNVGGESSMIKEEGFGGKRVWRVLMAELVSGGIGVARLRRLRVRKRGIPHSADSVRNDKMRVSMMKMSAEDFMSELKLRPPKEKNQPEGWPLHRREEHRPAGPQRLSFCGERAASEGGPYTTQKRRLRSDDTDVLARLE